MDYGYLAILIYLIICLVGLHDHNKKVEKMFPDYGDAKQNEMRRELSINMYGFGLLLLIVIGFFIKSILVK